MSGRVVKMSIINAVGGTKNKVTESHLRYGLKILMHENQIYMFPYFCAFLLKRFIVDFRSEEEQNKLAK